MTPPSAAGTLTQQRAVDAAEGELGSSDGSRNHLGGDHS